jgi:hypothetical protein
VEWIEIFRTGTHTDAEGEEREWEENDLDRIVSSYNPAIHEAPVVIGHPETDSPAYGWVGALKREGEFLFAKLKDLAPEFVDWVKRGFYKKRSIALYPDLMLRHVGFLGAVPPAIKGLRDVKFQGSGKITICFSENELKGGIEMNPQKKSRQERARTIGHKLVSLAEGKMEADPRLSYAEAMDTVQQENPGLISELENQPTERLGLKMSPRAEKARTIGYKIVSLVEEKMKADKRLSYAEAMAEVQRENRELILEYIHGK